MKHNQQMIDAYVRIRATGASHRAIAQYLRISKTTSCQWSHLHAKAIQETSDENREEVRFHKHFQRARELVHFNKIIENFLYRIENDRYGFGHTLSYKDTCRLLGLMVKSRESLLQKDGDNPIAVRSLAGHPANPSTYAAKTAPQPPPSQPQTPSGTTGTPVPVPQNDEKPQNPNKTNPSVENQPETVPQKNTHSVPVPEAKLRTHLPKGHGVRTTSAALDSTKNTEQTELEFNPQPARPFPSVAFQPGHPRVTQTNPTKNNRPPVPEPIGVLPSRPQHLNQAERIELKETSPSLSLTPSNSENLATPRLGRRVRKPSSSLNFVTSASPAIRQEFSGTSSNYPAQTMVQNNGLTCPGDSSTYNTRNISLFDNQEAVVKLSSSKTKPTRTEEPSASEIAISSAEELFSCPISSVLSKVK